MADVTLFNADSVPVHLDEAGHVLGAGEHGTGNPDNPIVAAAIAAGRLIVQPDAEDAAQGDSEDQPQSQRPRGRQNQENR